MGIYDSVAERLSFVKKLTPAELKKLGSARLSDVVLGEVGRARVRVAELEKRYPNAPPKELAQRLIDDKKNLASMAGGISGVFGLVALPADMLFMTYLQLVLLTDVATLYKANLKTERARGEMLDLFGYANGLGPLHRAGPKVLGKLASMLLEKGGLHTFGRAMPLVAAPITAYFNNQHIQMVGEQAVRFYEGFDKAHAKAKAQRQKASGS
ncbi:EcsC family protein [Pyxidicoccus fallax]|uniref:EcsC family protein n=1 Tax=Pyxidicoccus fallax TaxID=394095 RepID=A0A848LQ39_9BACT|nr:EcsC family protein [Pyxidicoccus fallax]NMO19760.1 EcsC family protein [Pyxidicoccus fallax]NPC80694.1 EcsC family protein [Pyxidicoccus fallax]